MNLIRVALEEVDTKLNLNNTNVVCDKRHNISLFPEKPQDGTGPATFRLGSRSTMGHHVGLPV